MLVKIIENNVLLASALRQLEEIKDKQDLNHIVALQLREHDTINRVDFMWTSLGSFKFLLRAIATMLAIIPISATLLTVTHFVWHWPW